MNIQTYIKEHRITRTDKVVLKKFRQEAFDEKGMKAIVYENSDYYHLRISVPFDYNEKGRWDIEWGEWLQNILAIESTAFGVDMLVSITKGGTCNILMNNPDKPFVDLDFPKLPRIAPPQGELTLKL
jgi:hypothetical protein